MDGRFLIYEGFGDDIEDLFRVLIKTFHFEVKNKNDSGVIFENAKVVLDFSYETVPVFWITDKPSSRDRLLNHIVRESKKHLKDELKSILGEDFYLDRKGSLERPPMAQASACATFHRSVQ
ncbi:MAG: hypothetical protein OCD76_07460 [Reichenbachiella sp.]